MRNLMATLTLSACGFLFSSLTYAIPTLQLDIAGGSYVGGDEESVLTTDRVFDLYAYGNPGGSTQGGGNVTTAEMLAGAYYLSIAISPQLPNVPLDLGTILVNGVSYNVTSDFAWGTPPLDATANPLLGGHGIYDTFYLELAFNFDPNNTAAIVNTQTAGGAGPDTSGTGMFYNLFTIDMTGLADGYNLHFDLYNTAIKRGDIVRGDFAPFSHDAGTAVPEPSSLALLGIGLLGAGIFSRRKRID